MLKKFKLMNFNLTLMSLVVNIAVTAILKILFLAMLYVF